MSHRCLVALQSRLSELQAQLDLAATSAGQAAQAASAEIESLKDQLNKERIANRKNTESVAKVGC